jgi:diguanylate cyclase (GGDEF)-like protein
MLGALRPAWPATAILAAAVLAAWLAPPLPASLAGLRTLGPYIALMTATGVSLWFNRGRAFVLALSLLAAFAALTWVPSKATHLVIAVAVPFNVLVALVAPERGTGFSQAWKWVALLILEVAAFMLFEKAVDFDHWLFRSPPLPLAARIVFVAALAAAVARAWPAFSPLDVGIGGALVAFYLAAEWATEPAPFSYFMIAAGLVVLGSVVHESHRMAFRDTLTGLPNRRALDEQLRALGSQYAIAMVDVDHFKSFNDTHGHDVGDQVLKLVAARLAESQGAGRAFRYGGEEFTVLFPGQALAEVLPQLESMRASIEGYKMAMRGEDRPKDKDEGSKRRGAPAAAPSLSVTVSIGAAEPGKRSKTAAEVVKAADEALYRAKKSGRNKVSK